MTPRKSGAKKTATRKATGRRSPVRKSARKTRGDSPMRQIDRAVGGNVDGLAHQAQSSHQPPAPPAEVPHRTPARTSRAAPAAPMNTPPAPSTPAVDQGQE
jgi:hypothetical protein